MKRRFILYRRKLGGTFYVEDTESRGEAATTSFGLRNSRGYDSRQRLASNRDDDAANGLSFLAALPIGQRSLIPESQPVVVEIVVTEIANVETGAKNC